MIKQHCIPLESPSEWKESLRGINHTFGHTWENCYSMSLTTGLKTFLYSFESDNVRIVCPIAEREYLGYVDIVKPFGFSGFVGNADCSEFQLNWQDFVQQRGYICGYLGLNPIFDYSSHFDPKEVHCYDNVHILDLTLKYEELWANLASNRKRQLKSWDTIRDTLILEKSLLIEFYLNNYIEFFKSKNIPHYYFFSKDTLSSLFSFDNVFMVGASNSNGIESVSVFVYTENAGEYLINVSLPGCNYHATALLWYGVNHLKSLKIPSLNLGGGSIDGIGEYKRRYGTTEIPLRCIKQIYNQDIYEELCQRVNVDPMNMAGYFPAYRMNCCT